LQKILDKADRMQADRKPLKRLEPF
jgi:hypothetical protein